MFANKKQKTNTLIYSKQFLKRMVLDVTLIIITLIALLVASYSDIRTREVPDWLNYGLIFTAFGIRTIFSFKLGWEIILGGVLGFLVLGLRYFFITLVSGAAVIVNF